MSNDLVETPAETSNDAEESATPEVAQPETATDGADKKPAEPTPEQLELSRMRRALAKRDRTMSAMHIEREQLRQQLAERQPAQKQAEPVQENPAEPRRVDEREVLTIAERIASQREFDAKYNSVADAGKSAFKDFPDALNALIEEAGPLVTKDGPTALGELILEADAPHKLIEYLGKRPELAATLDGLRPAQLARKLVAIEEQMTAKPKTSNAPKPLEPTKGAAAAGNELSDDLPLDEWLKRRNKQLGR